MNKYVNNFMHKVVVPLQYVLAVTSLFVAVVYDALTQIINLLIGFVQEVVSIIDVTGRKIGKGIQQANQIMKEALLKDYTKKEDNE